MQVLRSNDLFLGLPYNIIQFTTLQEVLAGWLGVEVGTYNHLSDSLHVYEKDLSLLNKKVPSLKVYNDDTLSCSYQVSRKLFLHLDHIIDILTKTKISIKLLNELGTWKQAPQSFRNILYILLAESARRNGFNIFIEDIMEKCSNQMIKNSWFNWQTYIIDKRKCKILNKTAELN
jgi:thymidylate synthase